MSKFTKFAVAGAGGIGSFVVDAFLKELQDVPDPLLVVLTRKGSDVHKKYPAGSGVTVREVDYADEADLVKALAGVEVVLSTLNGVAAPGAEKALAGAAKQAGVRVYAPSEYALDTFRYGYYVYAGKVAIHKYLKEIGLPYALIFTGGFTDQIFNPLFNWNFAERKVSLVGKGDTPVTLTTREDVGRYVAHVFTHASPSSLEWSVHRVEGHRVTLNQVAATYEKIKGVKLDVTHTDVEEVRKKTQGLTPPTDAATFDIRQFVLWAGVIWEDGGGLVGEPVNEFFPGFNPLSLEDAINKYF